MSSPYYHCQGEEPIFSVVNVVEICREVFNLLYNNTDAIEDLGLPNQYYLSNNFETTMNTIAFCFHKVIPVDNILVSTTHQISDPKSTYHSRVDIYYSVQEVEEVIKARVLHEATHALRFAMICCANKVGEVEHDKTRKEARRLEIRPSTRPSAFI